MGLLDNPYVDPQKAQEVYDDPKADKLSEEIAQKAITLLKNDGILPLKIRIRKLQLLDHLQINFLPFLEVMHIQL